MYLKKEALFGVFAVVVIARCKFQNGEHSM